MRRLALAFILIVLFPLQAGATDWFVDGTAGACAGNYSIANRNCTGTDGTSYATVNLASAAGTINRGDTLYLRAGTYQEQGTDATVWAGAAGQVTITPYNGETVTLNIKTGSARMLYLRSYTTWSGGGTFNLTNADNVAAHFFASGTAKSSIYFDRINVDHNKAGAAGYALLAQTADCAWDDFIITRSELNDIAAIFTQNGTAASANRDVITIAGCKIDTFYRLVDGGKLITLSGYNNTIIRGTSHAWGIAGTGGDLVVNLKNNNFTGSTNNTNARFFVLLSTGAATNLIANPANWAVTNNNLWNTDAMTAWDAASLQWISAASELMPMGTTNRLINPAFTAIGTGPADSDLTLSASSNAKARGVAVSGLFAGNDINNAAWKGNDIGCYSNPDNTATSPVLSGTTVAWVGDSGMLGVGASGYSSPTDRGTNVADQVFAAWNPSVIVVGGQGRSISGLDVHGVNALIDYVAWTDTPETIVLGIGGNNLASPKTNQTAAQLSVEIGSALQKIDDWGIRPIWLSIGSRTGSDAADVDTQNAHAVTGSATVNALVDALCAAGGWSYDSKLERYAFNAAGWKTGYYACLYTDATPGCSISNHNNDAGYLVNAGMADNMYWRRFAYYADDARGGTTRPGTWRDPQTVAGLNGVTAIPTGQAGRSVMIDRSTSTAFDTPVAGGAAAPLTLRGTERLLGGYTIDEDNWLTSGNKIF